MFQKVVRLMIEKPKRSREDGAQRVWHSPANIEFGDSWSMGSVTSKNCISGHEKLYCISDWEQNRLNKLNNSGWIKFSSWYEDTMYSHTDNFSHRFDITCLSIAPRNNRLVFTKQNSMTTWNKTKHYPCDIARNWVQHKPNDMNTEAKDFLAARMLRTKYWYISHSWNTDTSSLWLSMSTYIYCNHNLTYP